MFLRGFWRPNSGWNTPQYAALHPHMDSYGVLFSVGSGRHAHCYFWNLFLVVYDPWVLMWQYFLFLQCINKGILGGKKPQQLSSPFQTESLLLYHFYSNGLTKPTQLKPVCLWQLPIFVFYLLIFLVTQWIGCIFEHNTSVISFINIM